MPLNRRNLLSKMHGVRCRHHRLEGASIEIWQTDHTGHYDLKGYRYRATLQTGSDAKYDFTSVMPGHSDLLEPFAVDYTPDGTKFAVAGAGGTVSLFDAASGRKLKTSTNLGNPIMFIMMSPDGREVAAVDFDDFKFVPIGLRLWDLNSNEWKTVSLDLKNIIGAGKDKRNLVLIKSEGPEAISLWGVQ